MLFSLQMPTCQAMLFRSVRIYFVQRGPTYVWQDVGWLMEKCNKNTPLVGFAHFDRWDAR